MPAMSIPTAVDLLCPKCERVIFTNLTGTEEAPLCPHCGHSLWFLQKPVDEVLVLTFLTGMERTHQSFYRAEEILSVAKKSPRIVADLSRLQSISSLFLSTLVRLWRSMEPAHAGVKVCASHPVILEVFRATQLDTIFEIYGDEDAAVQSFST